MKSLKIGMVDLDTSHPKAWLPIIRSLGHEVVGVFDGGTVFPDGYAAEFASTYGIENVFTSLEAMADVVDLAIIHSCNWDLHVERARPFVNAGKAVFIDKPIAGNIRDLQQFQEWERKGICITGGSALRYCHEVQQWLSEHDSTKDFVYATVGCGVDEFNYGIHAYALLHGLLGSGIQSVRHLGARAQCQIEITYKDGRNGVVSIGSTKKYLPFYATIVTEHDVSYFQVDNQQLYRPMLERVLAYFSGEAPEPIPFDDLIEIELAAIAAKISWQMEEKRIFLKDIPFNNPGYDGARFAATYRLQKMG